MKMKYYSYLVLRANGKVEKIKVPQCFPVEALATRLCASIVVWLNVGGDPAIPGYAIHYSGKLCALDSLPSSNADWFYVSRLATEPSKAVVV